MNTICLFVSDLHGNLERYQKLMKAIRERKPNALFIGGDILPGAIMSAESTSSFLSNYLRPELVKLRDELKDSYPRIFMILGNDDGALAEKPVLEMAKEGLWEYAHLQKIEFEEFAVFGYSFVPPSPFLLKDWERYDVSRYVDPGCVSPEEGRYFGSANEYRRKWSTIQDDLAELTDGEELLRAIFLFHSPPYQTKLDLAALRTMQIDHAPLDPHVGSIAIQRFIEESQPLLTLHGHIHESARLTGSWRDDIGKTICLNASHDGSELSLISFSLDNPNNAHRELI